jgi:membrane protein YdbS with pleckstrin-like domain
MQEFDQIEALWAKHTVDVKISADDMLKQAKKEMNSMRTKSLLNIGGMILSVIAMAMLWLFYDVQNWTTHLGISIIITTILVYTAILYNNYKIISKVDFTINPTDFINKLKLFQLDRLTMYNRLYWFYTIALSLGAGLYFIEVLSHMEFWMQIIAIAVSIGWMVFCSTLVRKAVIKKDKERIALLIEKFERIGSQLQ